MKPPATIHTDFLNLYRAARLLPCVNAKSPYAGLFTETERRAKQKPVSWVKVKAHLGPQENGITNVERVRRLGNDMADKAANRVTMAHWARSM